MTQKTFDALDWLALLTTHIPNKNEQMVRYYGYYSNKSRGLRIKAGLSKRLCKLDTYKGRSSLQRYRDSMYLQHIGTF